jgi:hypothetical protein
MPATIARSRRARLPQDRRSTPRTCSEPPAGSFLFQLVGKEPSGKIVARDQADSPSRADRIARVWEEAGLAVETIPPRT